uniref:Uncharacterized protein n=1 Tax=Arundo donax TaxID=35708 RepID=A0A0A9AME8_ARUDO
MTVARFYMYSEAFIYSCQLYFILAERSLSLFHSLQSCTYLLQTSLFWRMPF